MDKMSLKKKAVTKCVWFLVFLALPNLALTKTIHCLPSDPLLKLVTYKQSLRLRLFPQMPISLVLLFYHYSFLYLLSYFRPISFSIFIPFHFITWIQRIFTFSLFNISANSLLMPVNIPTFNVPHLTLYLFIAPRDACLSRSLLMISLLRSYFRRWVELNTLNHYKLNYWS